MRRVPSWIWSLVGASMTALMLAAIIYFSKNEVWISVVFTTATFCIAIKSFFDYKKGQTRTLADSIGRNTALIMGYALLSILSGKAPAFHSESVPPRTAKVLVLLIPRKFRENLLGDLEEEFNEIFVPQYGLKAAKRLYWWHATYALLEFVLAGCGKMNSGTEVSPDFVIL
jgi:hypothetical protein